jgi:hypothetical protein
MTENDNTNMAQRFAEAVSAPGYFTKDSEIGDSITGTILGAAFRDRRDSKGKIQNWDDDTPQENLVITIETALSQFEGDDGKRSVYVKWWGDQRRDIAKAVSAAGATTPTAGDSLTVTYVGNGAQPKEKALSPEKLYEYEYTRNS